MPTCRVGEVAVRRRAQSIRALLARHALAAARTATADAIRPRCARLAKQTQRVPRAVVRAIARSPRLVRPRRARNAVALVRGAAVTTLEARGAGRACCARCVPAVRVVLICATRRGCRRSRSASAAGVGERNVPWHAHVPIGQPRHSPWLELAHPTRTSPPGHAAHASHSPSHLSSGSPSAGAPPHPSPGGRRYVPSAQQCISATCAHVGGRARSDLRGR